MTTFLIPVLFLSAIISQRGEVAPLPAPVVLIWGCSHCQWCDKAKDDVQHYRHLDFRYSKDETEYPAWLKYRLRHPKRGDGFPFVEWHVGRSWHVTRGWRDLPGFIDTYNGSIAEYRRGR